MSAEAKTTTITTEAPTQSPPEQSPEVQSTVLTIESAQDLLRSAILERFASIGADAAVVEITQDGNNARYSAEIGSGSHPWFLETGTATINEGEITHNPKKYFGRQIFATSGDLEEIATDSTPPTPHPYPTYVNDDLTELDPGDFFTAGPPDHPGTRILQFTGDVRIEIFGTEIERIEEEGEDGMLRITETETGEPMEITRIVGKRVEAVTGLELEQYDEPENPRDFYSKEPLFTIPPHIKKNRSDLAKVRITKTV